MRTNRHCITSVFVVAALLILGGLNTPVRAAEPYEGYNYSYWQEAVPSPNAYTPVDVINGSTLGIGEFAKPNDIFVRNELIYLLDSGNNRILVLDENYSLVRKIDGFQNGNTLDGFSNPQGLHITEDGDIYVADTDKRRIIHLNEAGEFLREVTAPESDILRANFQFIPTKVGVDRAQRIYTVSRGTVEGIIEFNSDGAFTSFLGAPRVTFNFADMIWKRISTKTQRDKMIQFIPTEFNNLDVDPSGFIFATTQTKSSKPIQRLNPMGINILKSYEAYEPIGDLVTTFDGQSMFSDIKLGNAGMYSALDTTKGRVFTYDDDGHLLYIFGQMGQQNGTFRTPVAIEYFGDKILVLDRDQALLTVFEPTLFGASINEAVKMQYEGRTEEAYSQWEKVLKLNANYDIAYIGIGKALLRDGKYKEAMHNFELGMDRKYYSKAFQMERKLVVRKYFPPFMSAAAILLFIFLLGPRIWRRFKHLMIRKGGVHVDHT